MTVHIQTFKLFAPVFFCVFACLPLRAWNAEGHMVVAQIAYNHLDPAVKAKCDALIAVPVTKSTSINATFVTAACWADDAKSTLGTGGWHYIDIPWSLDGTSTNFFVPDTFDVVQAINLCISQLENSYLDVTNQAVYLRYLLHFVGDIQQPLHCTTGITASHLQGDAGGNSFSVTGWSNLHSLWDAGGGYLSDTISRPVVAAGQIILDGKVLDAETNYPFVPVTGTVADPMTWALEGWNLGATVTYVGITNNTPAIAPYIAKTQSTTRQRMAAGGHRLADLLNTLFAPIKLSSTMMTDGVTLSWNALPGQSYQVEWKENFGDVWNPLTSIYADTNSVTYTDTPVALQRYYRITR